MVRIIIVIFFIKNIYIYIKNFYILFYILYFFIEKIYYLFNDNFHNFVYGIFLCFGICHTFFYFIGADSLTDSFYEWLFFILDDIPIFLKLFLFLYFDVPSFFKKKVTRNIPQSAYTTVSPFHVTIKSPWFYNINLSKRSIIPRLIFNYIVSRSKTIYYLVCSLPFTLYFLPNSVGISIFNNGFYILKKKIFHFFFNSFKDFDYKKKMKLI